MTSLGAKFVTFALPVFGALLLSACGPAENDPGPGGVTVGEARALDEAAEMLDEQNALLTEPGPQATDSPVE
ncbi:hypothetical protein [Parasphingorhabdus sp.]